jgi:hypothetical protein
MARFDCEKRHRSIDKTNKRWCGHGTDKDNLPTVGSLFDELILDRMGTSRAEFVDYK